MAIMYPNYVNHDISDGEREVFNRFSEDNSITKDWVVLHSFNISEHVRHKYNGEADFVILIPNKGILVLEVKAHREVIYDQNDGWCLGAMKDKRDPVKQAKDNMFSIKNTYINSYDSKLLIGWAVLFTHIDKFRDNSGTVHNATEFQSNPIIGSEVFWSDDFFSHIEWVMDGWKNGYKFARTLSKSEDMENLLQLLRPSICGIENPKAYFERREKEIIHLDKAQHCLLDVILNSMNNRIVFCGGAGTGKTILAVETLMREVSNKKRVLYITFNRHINDWVSTQFNSRESSSWITTMESLYSHWSSIPDEYIAKYDVLIVDEAQDIIFSHNSERYLRVLNGMLKNGLEDGRWIMFGDFSSLQSQYQQINGKSIEETLKDFVNKTPGIFLADLKKNYRNPNQIVNVCNKVFNQELDIQSRDEQAAISIIEFANKDNEVEKINEIINEVLKLGFSEQDIIILSTDSFQAAESRADILIDSYNQNLIPFSFHKKGIKYSSVGRFKGLESPIVILSNVNKTTTNSSLYTGITRALSRVYILVNQYYPTDSKEEMLKLI
ncbi:MULTISPECIES: NERD domain-containing protein [unclassified Bacillus (in: firmicutes)]|uniref:NERD domain-containing protein n=1 Tax=unclassified Bacillus (in: firmicutes) TaxID=185979 RepID=UPI0038331A5F